MNNRIYTVYQTQDDTKRTTEAQFRISEACLANSVDLMKGNVPSKYIIRKNDLPDLTPKKDFLVDYVNNTTLTGEAFTIDASEVHTFIFNLISPNE